MIYCQYQRMNGKNRNMDECMVEFFAKKMVFAKKMEEQSQSSEQPEQIYISELEQQPQPSTEPSQYVTKQIFDKLSQMLHMLEGRYGSLEHQNKLLSAIVASQHKEIQILKEQT